MGIDHHLNRNRLKSAAVKLDLAEPWVQTMILDEIASGRVDGVHLGPPCGTSSRARNIPIKKKLKRQGAPSPKPLRSSRWPDGLPTLKGVNKERVVSANLWYDFCRRVIAACEQHNVLFTVENPTHSLMWETSFFRHLVDSHFFSDVDACEYGSEQSKCSGLHVHEPWSIQRSELGKWEFDTAKAAECRKQSRCHLWMCFVVIPDFNSKTQLQTMPRKLLLNFNLDGREVLCWCRSSSTRSQSNVFHSMLWRPGKEFPLVPSSLTFNL